MQQLKLQASKLDFKKTTPSVNQEYRFVSLLPPLHEKKTLLNHTSGSLPDRLVARRSFLIFLWLHYLKKNTSPSNRVKVSQLPSNKKLLTLPKAPMAHKKTSKEQFLFSSSRFKVSVTYEYSALTVAQSKILSSKLHAKQPWFETNLFFLHSSTLRFPVTVSQFLSYKIDFAYNKFFS